MHNRPVCRPKFQLPASSFQPPECCVVLRMCNRSRLCYHFLFFYDDANATIGRQKHPAGRKTPHPPRCVRRRPKFQLQASSSSLQNVYPELRRAQPHPRNRFAALIQFLRATDRGSRATEILIANLELEFRPTHRKISPLRISNRKYFAIFHLTSQPPRRRRRAQSHPRKPFFTNHQSRVTSHEFLIYGSAIRNRRKALKT